MLNYSRRNIDFVNIFATINKTTKGTMMNEVLDKLPQTPLYENFNQFLAEAIQDKDDRAKILDYVMKSQIIGNPLMEEFYMTQSSAVFQLICHKKSWDVFMNDIDGWIETLEPRMAESAMLFFEGLKDFTQDIGQELKIATAGVNKGLAFAHAGMVEQTDRLVAQAKESINASAAQAKLNIDTHFHNKQIDMIAEFEKERRKTQNKFIESINTSIAPHVAKVFAAAADKKTALKFARDVGVCLVAFSIFSGLRWMFF